MSGEFSFANALAGAASDNATLSFAQDGGSGSSDEGSGGGGTLLAIGAVGLVGAGIAVLASGGGGGGGEPNRAPVAGTVTTLTTNEDTAGNVTLGATDPDGDTLTYTVPTTGTGAPTKGTVAVSAAGVVTYTPAADQNGADSFVVTIKDPDGLSVTQTVNVTITPVNDAPRADADNTSSFTAQQGAVTPFVISFTDPDGDVLTDNSVLLTVQPTKGVIGPDGTTYIANADATGSDSFTYTVSDGNGGTTTQVVTVAITPGTGVNLPPVVAAAIADQVSPEDTAYSFTVPAGTFTDPDSPALTYTASLDSGAALPSWLAFDSATRTFSGTPPLDFTGSFAIKVTASDGSLSASDTFNLTVGAAATTVSIDVGSASNKIEFDAASGANLYTDSLATDTNVSIINFGADDVINLSGAANLDVYSYTTGVGAGADDLIIQSNDGSGKFADIVLVDALAGATAEELFTLSDSASAIAIIGHNFITIA